MRIYLVFILLAVSLICLGCQTSQPPTATPSDIPARVEASINEAPSPPNPVPPTSSIATDLSLQPADSLPESSGSTTLSQEEMEREKRTVLKEINRWRAEVGLPGVLLGQNPGPQIFADQSLSNCSGGIWSMDGLNPYMRYSLAGGYQDSTELHLFSAPFCIQPGDLDYAPVPGLDIALREFVETGPKDSRMRKTILNPGFHRVSIGVALGQDRVNYRMVMLFERDVIEYLDPPALQEGHLVLRGRLKGLARFTRPEFIVQINYDLPPYPVNQGQIAWSRLCYSRGLIITVIRPPLPPGSHYPSDEGAGLYHTCPAPYEFPADIPAPTNRAEMEDLKEQLTLLEIETLQIPYIFVTADQMKLTDNELLVRADISHLVEEYGAGVYSASVLGEVDGVEIAISKLSFFVGFDPPETYGHGNESQ